MDLIVGKQGSQKISITDPFVSKRHCNLTIQSDGSILLEDLNSTNGTFVDGNRIVKTTVTKDTIIQLGPNYKVRVGDLLSMSAPPVQKPGQPPQSPKPVPEYSIKPLEQVWEEYEGKQREIQDTNRKITLLRSASPIFTLGGGALVSLSTLLNWGSGIQSFTIFLTFIGLLLMIYSFIKGYKFNSTTESDKAKREFQRKYVCPNPECNHFLGFQDYYILKQNKNCPYCKCKLKS